MNGTIKDEEEEEEEEEEKPPLAVGFSNNTDETR